MTAADDLAASRARLLDAAMRHVPFDGWTRSALTAGARSAGIDDATVARCFPRGVRDLVSAFSDRADAAMLAALENHDLAALPIRDRIALAVRLRLEALAPHREAVRRLIAWAALPGHHVLSLTLVHRTVDRIWYAIGDRSADFSWYTKRGLLAAIHSATVLYWLDDTTDGCAATWEFLDRRVDDVMQIPKLKSRAQRLGARLPDPLAFLRAVRAKV